MTKIRVVTTGQTGASRQAVATSFTPTGNIAATNVQTALAELDTEKQGKTARVTFSNADYTITAPAGNLNVAQVGTLTAPRTVTLPAASSVAAGTEIIVDDDSGTVTLTNTITVQRAGSDTINGATSETIAAAYGARRFISNGSNAWSFDAGMIRTSTLTADGDILTRASGAPARITRANLAADTSFSSRYAALSSSTYPSAAVATDGTYVRTQPTPDTGGLSIRPLCVDPDVTGRIWAVGSAFGQIGHTDNDGTSWTARTANPGSGGVQSMLFAGNFVYLSTTSQVWRSPKPAAAGTGLSWTKIWDTSGMALGPAGAGTNAGTNAELRNSCVAVSGSNGYIVEYGSTTVTGGPSLYYSSNIDTATASNVVFTKARTWTNGKHCHAVKVIGGVPWVTIGDATFTDIGVWTATSASAAVWNRRSLYGELNNGTMEYGINMVPLTIGGQNVVAMEYDGYGPAGVLIHGSQDPTVTRPTRRISDLPYPHMGSMRGLTVTAAGHLMWVTTGENAAIGPLDSIWIAKAPFTNPILLESFTSNNSLGTIGDPVTSNGFAWFGTYRCRIPTLY